MFPEAAPWPDNVLRLTLDEVDSTMAEARRRLPGLAGPAWIMARRQTAGRGRRGRAWADPGGNFAATLVMRPGDPPARLALRSFVAALALREALVSLGVPDGALALKWPNDLLLDSGKVSGILLETLDGGALAVGIGVNLASAPEAEPGAAFAPVTLARHLPGLTPEALLDHLAPAFALWEGRLVTYGFAPLRAAFLRHAARLGQPLIARTQHAELSGTFETLDDDGALVLRTATGPVAVPAADIFFP